MKYEAPLEELADVSVGGTLAGVADGFATAEVADTCHGAWGQSRSSFVGGLEVWDRVDQGVGWDA